MKKYTMKLRSVGNPDFNQYAPISPPEIAEGDTLQEMRNAARAYIEKWNLGGGNHPNTVIKESATGKSVAWISYNGRVWDRSPYGKDWQKSKEIVI